MKKQTINAGIVDNVKRFLLKVGAQFFDNGKSIYYLDYNNIPKKLTRI